jgi:3-methyladenine DNA glycosylase AlkD
MKTREARELGARLAPLVRSGQIHKAYTLLAPALRAHTKFDLLRLIAEPIGAEPLEPVNAFLARIAADKTEGGWVVIGKALEGQLTRDMPWAFARCRDYIATADVWYAADILGEGLAGEALVAHFEPALPMLLPWREDANRWVRRAVGVGTHFWAKRSEGAPERAPQAQKLLNLLEPLFEEREMDAVKGIGWGLKTLGRNYPDLATDWLVEQVVRRERPHRALMLRKAMSGLSDAQRTRIVGSQVSSAP